IGNATDFELWRATELGETGSWSLAVGGIVEAIAEGLFRGSLPVAGSHQAFVRVRRVDPPPIGLTPVFNEVMSDNLTAHEIGTRVYLDWLELFNPHDEALTLEGYGLSDDPLQPARWTFPAVTLQPGAFLVVYASDAGAEVPDLAGVLCANFGLRGSGETLVLTEPFGREVDRVILPPLAPDQSLGRIPDGGPRWNLYSKSQITPGLENSTVAESVVVAPPEFSVDGGFHPGPVEVRMSTREPDGVIRFTTNGAPPSTLSPHADAPFAVGRTMVIRAVTYEGEGGRSEETARTYFIGVRHSLPVVSMAMAASNLEFKNGYLLGMGSRVLNSRGEVLQNYPFPGSNARQDREVEAHLEFHEPDGRLGLRQRAGVKVYGGWGSRGYPQKSLALFARKQYGAGRFKHELFPGQAVDEFESLVLRNSGNDNQSTHQIPPRPPITEFGATESYGSYFVNGTFTLLRDSMMQRLLADGTDLDAQAYRPVVVYLNGEYWGIYNLREKLDEHHVVAHHELPRGAIDLIEGYGDARAGDGKAYLAMRDYVATRSMAVEANYQFVADTWLEIDNFIDYNLAVIYFQNFDIGNVKCWRPRTPRGRFHWMVYDQDYGFHLWPEDLYVPAMARDYADYANMFEFATAGTGTSNGWPNAGGRTLLLRRLLANPGFRERFIRRGADLLNTAFRADRVESIIGGMASAIRPEIPAHLQRWSWDELKKRGYGAPYQPEYQPFTAATWEANLQVLTHFARVRAQTVRAHCAGHFGLEGGQGELRIDVEPAGAGEVQLNSLRLAALPWQGTYFVELPNTLVAVAKPGFRFREWSTPSGEVVATPLAWTVENGLTNTLTARFEPMLSDAEPQTRLWITEFNYHSPDDLEADDWVEIHNPGEQPVNLAGWVLRDAQDDAACVLPAVVLAPGGYRVLARRVVKFQWAHPTARDPIATFDFGLGNGGEVIRLFDPAGVEVTRIAYEDDVPWPKAADGGGSTLQLARPELNHSSPQAWVPSAKPGGTPGEP
ncbi:MAG: CotH kinase family protein, partial [Limisphaerales bacterium]